MAPTVDLTGCNDEEVLTLHNDKYGVLLGYGL